MTTDPLADFMGLTDVALRRRTEPVHGIFIAEGVQAVRRALSAGYTVRTLVVTPDKRDRHDVVRVAADVVSAGGLVHVGDPMDLRLATGYDVHRGVLASFSRRELPTVEMVASGALTLAVLEAVVDHTNVGAIFRSVTALGVDGIVLDPQCADPLYRRAIRTSMGAVFAVPYARCPSWPGGLVGLRSLGFRVLALTPHGATCDLSDLDVGPRDRVALLLGSEGRGLSRSATDLADATVSIRMSHGVDSLNVATSAALAFWAVARAREQP